MRKRGNVEQSTIHSPTPSTTFAAFLLLKNNNYVITVRKENDKDSFILLFDEYEIGFEPKKDFPDMTKIKNGSLTKITTGFINESGNTKVNKELLELSHPNFNLN